MMRRVLNYFQPERLSILYISYSASRLFDLGFIVRNQDLEHLFLKYTLNIPQHSLFGLVFK